MATAGTFGGGGFCTLVVLFPHPARIEIIATERSKRTPLLNATASLRSCLIMIVWVPEPGSVSLERGALVTNVFRALKHTSPILHHEKLLSRSSQMYDLCLSNCVSNGDGSGVKSNDLWFEGDR